MAGSLNKVMIIGNLGRDPEVRYTNDNRPIANLNIATTDSWKDQQTGNRQERTEWHRIVLFGPLAEVAQKYLKKGDSAYFEGRLQTRKWTNKEGQDQYTTEIVVDRNGVMQMLGGKGTGSGASYGGDDFNQSMPENNGSSMKTRQVSEEPAFDDDIPF